MFHIFRRIGFFRRRWIWALLLLAAFGAAGYWMVPWRGSAADLQLVAMRPDGTFASTVHAAALTPQGDSAAASAGAASSRGVPIVLAIANNGMRAGRPERLVLALPRWYRLTGPAHGIRNEILPDEPLQRYVVEVDFPEIQSGRVPTLLPAIDTLWLEPFVPDYWCTADVDSVPVLIPSTPPDTGGIVPVQVYWSFEGAALTDRQTGLLTVQLPGSMFRRTGTVDFAQSPVNMEQPRVLRPAMGALVEGGSHYAECGAPGDPMRIFSALWITPGGGRLISIHYGGQPRKEYYDLNRDSIIELEMWDPDGDGEMEAWRTLRMPIPEYLLPQDPMLVADSIARADSARADSAAAAAAAADSVARAALLAPADTTRAPSTGGALIDLPTLSRMLIPGDVSRARRLFVRRPPPPPPVRDDGPIGTPLGAEPARPAAPAPPPRQDPAPVQPNVPEPAAPEPAAPEPADEEEPDLIDRVLQEAAEQDAADDDE